MATKKTTTEKKYAIFDSEGAILEIGLLYNDAIDGCKDLLKGGWPDSYFYIAEIVTTLKLKKEVSVDEGYHIDPHSV